MRVSGTGLITDNVSTIRTDNYNMLTSLVRRVKPVQASVCAVRNIQTTQTSKKHTLPDLPYDYNALEPVISAEIMQLHHGK